MKKFRKLLGIIICLCMLVGVTSVTSYAASTVSIYNITVTAPKAGEKPSNYGTVPATASTMVTNVEWIGNFAADGTFISGEPYTVKVTCSVKPGLDKVLKYSESKAKINENPALFASRTSDMQNIVLQYTFPGTANQGSASGTTNNSTTNNNTTNNTTNKNNTSSTTTTTTNTSGTTTNKQPYKLGDSSIYVKKFLKDVYPQIKTIGDGYFSFSDTKYKNVEKVPLGTVIQGVEIDPKYLDQNNMANLEALFSFVIGDRPNYDKSIAYKEGSGTGLQIVAETDTRVIFWSNGYRGFTELGPASCNSDSWLQTHPPGFYQIQKCKVWYCIPDKEYNIIPDGKEKDVAATGMTTGQLNIRIKPSKKEDAVYEFSKRDEISLASTEKIPAIDGSGDTYYKVIWQGYMNEPCYCYVNSLYVDVEIKGSGKPSDLEEAHITNLKSGEYTNIYTKKDTNSQVAGKITLDVNVKYSPSQSDKEWVVLWFSGQKCYIPAKYVKGGKYIPLINTGNLGIKDIVDGQYVMRWDPINVNNDYSVAIVSTANHATLNKGENYYLYQNINYKTTEFTVDSSMFMDGDRVLDKIYFKVKANSGTETFTYLLPRLTVLEETKKRTWDKAGGIIRVRTDETGIYLTTSLGDGTQMQVSTDKNFKKDVKTAARTSISSLEPETTYYVRFRKTQSFTTADGKTLVLKGKWSKKKKITTDKAQVYDYVPYIEVVDVVNGEYVVSWPKVTNTKSYTVRLFDADGDDVYYTNKNYTSNTFTIKNEYMKKANGYLAIGVEANKQGKYPDEEMTEVLEGVITTSPVEDLKVTSHEDYAVQLDESTVVPKCEITLLAKGVSGDDVMQIQYADNKELKNATTTELGYSGTAKDLNLSTTYYCRYRYCKVVDTRFGDKIIYGNWSKVFELKTKDKVDEPTISG